MKIVSTAIILGLTLLVVPLMTYWFGTPLNDSEWSLIKKTYDDYRWCHPVLFCCR